MKYDALTSCLQARRQQMPLMTFAEIEKVLGFTLPPSAYRYRAWWANGGHIQADAWMKAGYLVDSVDLAGKKVSFRWTELANKQAEIIPADTDSIILGGYMFRFVQLLIPEQNADGSVKEYYPQKDYPGNKELHAYGHGAFCRFSITADDRPGVYLWRLDGEILYIGETMNMRRRFNNGYGNIEPVNCYLGGQTTNCKMNKVVLNLARNKKYVELYFYETRDHKRVELELLSSVKTRYNIKDN